jgi:hypothetical protein
MERPTILRDPDAEAFSRLIPRRSRIDDSSDGYHDEDVQNLSLCVASENESKENEALFATAHPKLSAEPLRKMPYPGWKIRVRDALEIRITNAILRLLRALRPKLQVGRTRLEWTCR